MIKTMEKIEELLGTITCEDYEDGDKIFREFENYDNIYKVSHIVYEYLKNIKNVYDEVIHKTDDFYYGFKDGKVTKYKKSKKDVEKGDLIFIAHSKTLLGYQFKDYIYKVEGVHLNNKIVADHISVCMCALYKNDYIVLELVDERDITY